MEPICRLIQKGVNNLDLNIIFFVEPKIISILKLQFNCLGQNILSQGISEMSNEIL